MISKVLATGLAPLMRAQYTCSVNYKYTTEGQYVGVEPTESSQYIAEGMVGKVRNDIQTHKRAYMGEVPWLMVHEADRISSTGGNRLLAPHRGREQNDAEYFYARTYDNTHPATKPILSLTSDKWEDQALNLPLIHSLCQSAFTIHVDDYGRYSSRIMLHPGGTIGQLHAFGLGGVTDTDVIEVAHRLPGIEYVACSRDDELDNRAEPPMYLKGFALRGTYANPPIWYEDWNAIFVPFPSFPDVFGFPVDVYNSSDDEDETHRGVWVYQRLIQAVQQ